MPRIPIDTRLDVTLSLLRNPYGFISERSRRYGAAIFQTRLALRPVICLTGEAAAKLLYHPGRFARCGVAPARVQQTLFGRGGVQGLDGAAHRQRKAMFMSLMTPERIDDLTERATEWWRVYARKWALLERVTLYDEVPEILMRSVCAWAGVPLDEAEVQVRTRQMTALFDQAGSLGPKHYLARLDRLRAERWLAGLVRQIRAGRLTPPPASAAAVIAWHREPSGDRLSPRVAAVELINVIRPTVAVAVYIVMIGVALQRYPGCRQQLATDEGDYTELFVQEVRRFYPFFPLVGARARRDVWWNGYRIPRGRLVLLDLYGTNHDPQTWQQPGAFRPERFRAWDGSPFNFIPQGGGDHFIDHRCAGEWITIALMKAAARFLAGQLTYDVPEQDLRIDRRRLPALPRSRFVISNVRSAR